MYDHPTVILICVQIEQKLNRLQPSKAPAVIPPPPPPPVPGLAAPKPPESGPKPPGSPKPPRSPSLKPSPSISPKESPSSSPFLGGKFPQLRRVEKKPGRFNDELVLLYH